jgi:hypothetical protein
MAGFQERKKNTDRWTNNFGDRKSGKTIEKGVVLFFKLTASHLRETAGFQKKRGFPYNWGGRKGFLLEEQKCWKKTGKVVLLFNLTASRLWEMAELQVSQKYRPFNQ